MPRRNLSNKRRINQLAQPVLNQQCQSKRRFPTEKQAARAADDQMLTDFHLRLGIYRCEHCQGWHLTNQGKA